MKFHDSRLAVARAKIEDCRDKAAADAVLDGVGDSLPEETLDVLRREVDALWPEPSTEPPPIKTTKTPRRKGKK